jgi:hypothetical protein
LQLSVRSIVSDGLGSQSKGWLSVPDAVVM